MTYRLWVEDGAKTEIRRLPGNVRQRLKREVAALSDEPRPPHSRLLRLPAGLHIEARRLRLDEWRVIYVVDDTAAEVGILAVRRRPPYDYSDLPQLLVAAD
jgi:mRNA interferase RelE/StbE